MSTVDVCLSPVREGPRCITIPPLDEDPIGIYLAVGGSVIPMRVLESDSIASVKLRIQSCNGYVAKKQKLVFGGRELARNNSLLREYGVSDGNVIHLLLRFSDLHAITIITTCGEEFEFQVDPNENIGYLKKQLAKKGNGYADLEDHELFCNGEKLFDQKRLVDICKNTDVMHLVVQKSTKIWTKSDENEVEFSFETDERTPKRGNNQIKSGEKPLSANFLLEPVLVNLNIKFSPLVYEMFESTLFGLQFGKAPRRSSEGTGGTYFMQDAYKKNDYVSVFKPIDEEPMAMYNPNGLPLSENGEGLKRGTRVGEGAIREVVAYLLDHPKNGPRSMMSDDMGFAGVQPTIMVRCLHKEFNHPDGFDFGPKNIKVGSLQMFMKNDGNCEDMGPGEFPVEEVHKISVLDIRMANADRHAGNILMKRDGEKGTVKLIPIDHGYCLPENFEDCTFEWLYWPQAREPYSHETLEYINSLNAEKDIELLKSYGWELSLECARTLQISTMLLKKGAKRGLSPFKIGSIMCRETLNNESVIEKIVKEARDSILPGMSEQVFLEDVSEIMDFHIEEIAK